MIAAATTPWVLLGLLVFAVSAVAWLAALSRVPLSLAYPSTLSAIIVILTASIVVLHERANLLTWAGSLSLSCRVSSSWCCRSRSQPPARGVGR